MADFAIVQDGTVVNVIVAADQAAAESLTGMSALPTNGRPWIGWTLEVDGWKSPRPAPFESWPWDYELMEYVAPVPYPTDGADYSWAEDSQEWVLITPVPD